MIYRLLLLCLCLSFPSALLAATRFTLLSPENSQDMRMRYYREVMELALEKTRPEYGDYELLDSLPMNKARMRLEVQEQGKSALFIVDSWPYQGKLWRVRARRIRWHRSRSRSIWGSSAIGSVSSARIALPSWRGLTPWISCATSLRGRAPAGRMR